MATYKCVGCGFVHEDFNWKFRSYEVEEERKLGYFCRKWFKSVKIDWVPERIKKDRVKYAGDIVQPFRGGEPSKEFIERYPEKAKKMFTAKERKGAKNVWKDIKGL